MAEARVRLGFRNASDGQIATIAAKVIDGMTGNEAFLNPPVSIPVLQATLDGFNAAIAARPHGGRAATAYKNKCRHKVMQVLRRIAGYVETNCDNDLAILLSSGFPAKDPSRIRTPCPKAVILSINNGHTAELLLRVDAIKNARCYEVQSALVGARGMLGPWQNHGAFRNSRLMRVKRLMPGRTYAFQVRAVGGSERYGPWSDPVRHMCM